MEKYVELTIEQAKELQMALNELFEEKVRIEKEYIPQPYPVFPIRPWRPFGQDPWITWRTDIPMYTNTCGTNMQLENNSIRVNLNS